MSLYANGLRAEHHISAKTTFLRLCAPAHKVRESRPPGSVRGVLSNGHPYRDNGQPLLFGSQRQDSSRLHLKRRSSESARRHRPLSQTSQCDRSDPLVLQ